MTLFMIYKLCIIRMWGDSMSDYQEQIKKFDKVRDYIHSFYLYGYNTRGQFNVRSTRSYDNEKRRIESYLAEYITYTKDERGKQIAIEADCATLDTNPLYRAFKAKSFTKNDISLHFYIFDLLKEYQALSAPELMMKMDEHYTNYFNQPMLLDLSTIRKKLNEYESLGLLSSNKQGKKVVYSITKDTIDLNTVHDSLCFFSEVSPLGVVGNYLLDKIGKQNDVFRFKHHYIMHALESEVVLSLVQAMNQKKKIRIDVRKNSQTSDIYGVPIKILISVQTGRRYLCLYYNSRFRNIRLDHVKHVTLMNEVSHYEAIHLRYQQLEAFTWGSSYGDQKKLEHLSIRLAISFEERYIINRIENEGRHGVLTFVEEGVYQYDIDVYDTMEMLPWIRTFIGRIIQLEGTNTHVISLFYDDLNRMLAMYGGDQDVV